MKQTLAVIRDNEKETRKISPFKQIYNRDVVLIVDNILQRRRTYYGVEHHQIAFHKQRKFFLRSKAIVCKANEKQQEYAENRIKQISFELGEPIYFKNHWGGYKLDKTWKPYYTVIERTGPFTY